MLWVGERQAKVFNVLKPKVGLAGATRGSPSLVNGVRLRTSSLRGSTVQIPPPAPAVTSVPQLSESNSWEPCLAARRYAEKGLVALSTSSASVDETSVADVTEESALPPDELRAALLWTNIVSGSHKSPIPVKRPTIDSFMIKRPWARPAVARVGRAKASEEAAPSSSKGPSVLAL